MHITVKVMLIDLYLHTIHLAISFLAKCLSSPMDSPDDTEYYR